MTVYDGVLVARIKRDEWAVECMCGKGGTFRTKRLAESAATVHGFYHKSVAAVEKED